MSCCARCKALYNQMMLHPLPFSSAHRHPGSGRTPTCLGLPLTDMSTRMWAKQRSHSALEPKYKIWGEGRLEDWGGAGVQLRTWSTQAAPEVQAEQPQVAALRGCPMPLSPLSYTSFKMHFHLCSCQGPARVPTVM